MGLFFYTQKGSIISTVDLPTTEIIEPENAVNDILVINVETFQKIFWKGADCGRTKINYYERCCAVCRC